jgi:hypothetical protein
MRALAIMRTLMLPVADVNLGNQTKWFCEGRTAESRHTKVANYVAAIEPECSVFELLSNA